jgi:biopolymer transport protein ExbD
VNLSPLRREEPEVNLTSLIDVVFLLLIFFMVSTSFIREASLSLQLPTASSAPVELAEPVEITVGADGRYFFGSDELVNTTPATLRRALLDAAGGDTTRVIVVRADARAQHQAVVTVIDAAGRAGFAEVSIVTAQDTDG